MVRLAVAGGTGGLGRTVVNALASSKEHEVFVFTRKTTSLFAHFPNVKCLITSYDNAAALADLLDRHEIHTIISTLNPPASDVFAAEKTLIDASIASDTVKRFMPSQFAIDYEVDHDHLPLSWKSGKNAITAYLRQQTRLEYTLFHNGYFMDYFGTSTHMLPEVPFVDIEACKASIPGSGDVKVTFTHTADVARFVVKLVESSEKWPEKSVVIGDKATFSEIVEMGEKARGFKFDVMHNGLADLRQGKIMTIPAWESLYKVAPKGIFDEMFSAFGLSMALGDVNFDERESLNSRFSDLETGKLVDIIEGSWARR